MSCSLKNYAKKTVTPLTSELAKLEYIIICLCLQSYKNNDIIDVSYVP